MKQEEMLGLVDPAGITMNTYNNKKILLKQESNMLNKTVTNGCTVWARMCSQSWEVE